jgi:outer membrane protein
LRSVEQQVLLGAAQAYVNVTLQQEMVAMQDSNVRLVTQDLRAAQDRFDVGEVTKTDVSQAQAQLAAAKAQLAAAQGQLALARESYKAAVGHYPGALAALPRAPKLPASLTAAQAIAVKTNPQVLSAQHQSLAADARVAQTKAGFMPNVTAGVQAQVKKSFTDPGTNLPGKFNSAGTSDVIGANLQLTQTLYAGGQISALYRKSLDAQDASKSALQYTAVQVTQLVGNAWANLGVAAASISAGDQQIAAAQSALDGVKEEATVGSRTTLDVLNAEQALLSAKANRLQSVANLYNGQYALLSTMGLMTADHLNLGIPKYDPQLYYDAVKSAPATSSQGAKLDKIMKLMGRD